jgi:oligopeptide transport system ATP-binding protein
MPEYLLEVNNLEVKFSSPKGLINAVNNISFFLNKGEVLGIVGESGSGKTVSALSLLNLLPVNGRITNGEILFENKDLLLSSKKHIRQIRGNKISMIFQDPMSSLNPLMKIGKQVNESMIYHKIIDQKSVLKKTLNLLKKTKIPSPEEGVNNYPHQFSGGMRQRAMIAMGLSCNPSILIADEPTTALDVTVQAQIIELVKDLKNEYGMSVVWITHDLGVLASIADRVLVMYAGKIVEEASVFDIFSNPKHPYTKGLIDSIPRLDRNKSSGNLQTIEGAPPDLISYPKGCPFSERCMYTKDICREMIPINTENTKDHYFACHNPLN